MRFPRSPSLVTVVEVSQCLCKRQRRDNLKLRLVRPGLRMFLIISFVNEIRSRNAEYETNYYNALALLSCFNGVLYLVWGMICEFIPFDLILGIH